MVTTIVKWGNSQGIRLPKILLESVCLSENDMVDVTTENNQIVIKKVEQKKYVQTIQERFEGYKGNDEPIDIDWGEPKGREVW